MTHSHEADAYRAAGIQHIRLSPEKVEAWAAARDHGASGSPEL